VGFRDDVRRLKELHQAATPESIGPLSIVYRDRPEYEHRRRRYREIVLGE